MPQESWPFVEVERKETKQQLKAAHLLSSSVKEWFCLTRPEIYDVDEVFTEVKAAHFPNQFVKHLLISRDLFINHEKVTVKNQTKQSAFQMCNSDEKII